MRYKPEPHAPHHLPTRTGLLLANLGTPDATDYRAMRRYLKQFLSDPRVIEENRLKWWFVLNVILLSFIPFKSGRNYDKIWDKEKNDSPLRLLSETQRHALEARFAHEDVPVALGMRYGNPSLEKAIDHLKAAGCDKLILLPLYPQYCAATTASVYDAVFDSLKKRRWMPALRSIPAYFNHPLYISALAESIYAQVKEKPLQLLLVSYHGLPIRYDTAGDPYRQHCEQTTALLQEALAARGLNLPLRTSYQSQFGKEEWLKPATDHLFRTLATEGVTDLAVITPGFAVDCVETLEEIDVMGRETFLQHGGQSFTFIPCLNAESTHIDLLEALCREEGQGWL